MTNIYDNFTRAPRIMFGNNNKFLDLATMFLKFHIKNPQLPSIILKKASLMGHYVVFSQWGFVYGFIKMSAQYYQWNKNGNIKIITIDFFFIKLTIQHSNSDISILFYIVHRQW